MRLSILGESPSIYGVNFDQAIWTCRKKVFVRRTRLYIRYNIIGMYMVWFIYDKCIIICEVCCLCDCGGMYRDKSPENRFDRPSRLRFPSDRPETKLCTPHGRPVNFTDSGRWSGTSSRLLLSPRPVFYVALVAITRVRLLYLL